MQGVINFVSGLARNWYVLQGGLTGDRTEGKDDIKDYDVTASLRHQWRVRFRAVRLDDKGLVIDALNRVSAESIYRRFLTTNKEITLRD